MDSFVGKTFGRLTVIKRDLERHASYWCKCTCGRKVSVQKGHLVHGMTKSCGCLHKEVCSKKRIISKSKRTQIAIRNLKK